MHDISNLRTTIVPRLDQINSEQLLGGPLTITITDVEAHTSIEQPISIHYEGEEGRAFKPCLTMRKLIIFAWGENGNDWIGRSMTLYNDPSVKWGGVAVGGIRISHLSDIDRDIEVKLTETRGKKALYTVKRLEVTTLDQVLEAIAAAKNKAGMDAAKAIAKTLNRPADIEAAQDAFRARVAELKNSAPAA